MSSVLNNNAVKKKVLAKINAKIKDKQAQYDREAAEIDNEYNEKRLALLEELATINADKKSDKDALASKLADELLP